MSVKPCAWRPLCLASPYLNLVYDERKASTGEASNKEKSDQIARPNRYDAGCESVPISLKHSTDSSEHFLFWKTAYRLMYVCSRWVLYGGQTMWGSACVARI